MVKMFLGLLFILAAVSGFSEPSVHVLVLDGDLGTPLEGVQIRVPGAPGSFVTDEQGTVTAELPDGQKNVLVTATLLGYKTLKKAVASGEVSVVLKMTLEGTVEGQELVVERTKPQKTDAQGGVSQVVTGEDIQAQSMGIVEDAISAVKTLPGVAYSGNFDSRPSVNGGSPDETVASLDGAYVLAPYQWGGAFTIFNPDMVDSIKLSDGIIGAPYGQVMSGLLEVSSKTPVDTDQHLDFGFSTTGLDLFLQQAFGSQGGVLVGGKVTWMEVPLTLVGEQNLFATDPFIRNGTAKVYWNPTPGVNWTLGANVDTDGVASGGENIVFNLSDTQVLVSSGLKVMVAPDLLWNWMLSYNSLDTESGFRFPDRDNSALNNDSNDSNKEYRYQLRTSVDWDIGHGQLLSYGIDEMFENWSKVDSGDRWTSNPDGTYSDTVTNTNITGKNTVTSGIYLNDNFILIPGVLTGEGGLRVDHSFVFGGGELLMTYPVLNPRIRLTYTFIRDWGLIQTMDINGGSGLYSQFPADNPAMDSKYGVVSLEVGPTRAWFTNLGLDITGKEGETLTLEGYAKDYLNRFYSATGSVGNTVLSYDGTGYAYGIDLGVKKQTRFWDFSLSNSFNITQLNNPGVGLVSTGWTTPLGTWYFPSYEVADTLYIDLTVKPDDGFSILTQGTLASGSPTSSGTWSNWKYPVDIKLDWHGFYEASEVRWETYVGCEDVFALVYFVRPTGGASFSAGVPIPSVGYKISY